MDGLQMTEGSNRPFRIAVVTQGYQSAGGIQTVARWLASNLRAGGYQVVVFDLATSRSDPYSRRLTSPGTWRRSELTSADHADDALIHVGANGVEFEPLRYLPRAELTAQLELYDVVQVVAGGPALAVAASKVRRPIVVQVATTVAWERASQTGSSYPLRIWRKGMSAITSRMEKTALRAASAVIVYNREMQHLVQSFTETRVELAFPGIDIERFTPQSELWSRDGYLLSVCRLNDNRKGLDRLIRSYALMIEQRPTLPHLILAGRGTLPPHLRQLIVALNLADRVSVRSDVPESCLAALYGGASIYLQASHEEGLGISVLEAMACGIPVVSTETAGTLETVVHGETGWLVSQGRGVELSLAQRSLSVWDGDAQAMSLRARSRVESLFATQIVFSRFAELYNQLTRDLRS